MAGMITTTVRIEAGLVDVGNRTITFPVTFSNAGAGLTSDDFTWSGTTTVFTASLSGTGNSRTLTLTAMGNSGAVGTLVLGIRPNAFTDRQIIGTPRRAINFRFPRRIDATLTYTSSSAEPVHKIISFWFRFDTVVRGLTGDDFTVSGTTEFTKEVIQINDAAPQLYRLNLRYEGIPAVSGSLNVTLNTNTLENVYITGSRVSPDQTYSFDARTPTTVTFGTPVVNVPGREVSFPMTFSDAGLVLPTAFDITSDLGWTYASFTGTGNTRTFTIYNRSNSARSGTVSITLRDRAIADRYVTGGRVSPSASVSYPEKELTSFVWASPVVDNDTRTVTFSITFSNPGYGLDLNSFDFLGPNGVDPGLFSASLQQFGSQYVITLSSTNEDAEHSWEQVAIRDDAFRNRQLVSTERSARAWFQFVLQTSVTFGTPVVNSDARTVRYSMTFSNPKALGARVGTMEQRGLQVRDLRVGFTRDRTSHEPRRVGQSLYRTDEEYIFQINIADPVNRVSGTTSLELRSDAFPGVRIVGNRTAATARIDFAAVPTTTATFGRPRIFNDQFRVEVDVTFSNPGLGLESSDFVGRPLLSGVTGQPYFSIQSVSGNTYTIAHAGGIPRSGVGGISAFYVQMTVWFFISLEAFTNRWIDQVFTSPRMGYFWKIPSIVSWRLEEVDTSRRFIYFTAVVGNEHSVPSAITHDRLRSDGNDFLIAGWDSDDFEVTSNVPLRLIARKRGANLFDVYLLPTTTQNEISGTVSVAVKGGAFSYRTVIGNTVSETASFHFPARTGVTWSQPRVDNIGRTVAWDVTFRNPGAGLTVSDFSFSSRFYQEFTGTLTGSGNSYTITATHNSPNAVRGFLSTRLGGDAFSDRIIGGDVFPRFLLTREEQRTTLGTPFGSRSPSAEFNFPDIVHTTITWGDPVVNNNDRTIAYPMSFSDIGNRLTADDFTVSGTTTFEKVLTGEGTTRTLTLVNSDRSATSGSLNVTINEDAFPDRIVFGNRVSGDATYAFPVAPATTVTYGTPIVDNDARTIRFPVTFSNAGIGLTVDDFTLSAGTPFTMELLGAGNVREVLLTNSQVNAHSGSAIITLDADAFTSRSISGGRVSPTATYNFVAITTVEFSDATVDNVRRTITYSVLFSNAGAGLTADDFAITGVIPFTSVLTGSGDSRTLTLSNSETAVRTGVTFITLASDAFTDRIISGNRQSADAEFSYLATSTITFSAPTVDNAARTISYTLTFSDAGDGLTSDDFVVSGDVPFTAAVSGSGNTRTLLLTNTESVSRAGNANVTINQDAFSDRVIAGNRVSVDAAYNFITETAVAFGTPSVSAVSRSISYAVSFSNAGTGLTADDFTVSGAVSFEKTLTVSGFGYLLRLTNTETVGRSGSVNVTIAPTAFTDRFVTGVRVSADASYNFPQIQRTTVTFGSPVVDNAARTITYAVSFSNPGAGLTDADFTLSGTTSFTKTLTGSGNSRTLRLQNTETLGRTGTLVVTLSEEAFTDRVVSGNRASGGAAYNFAQTSASVDIITDRTLSIPRGTDFSVFFEWSQIVTGFDTDDITISAGTKGDFTGSGSRYRLFVTAPTSGSINEIVVTVRAAAVNETNVETQHTIELGVPQNEPVVMTPSVNGYSLALDATNVYTTGDSELPTSALGSGNQSIWTYRQSDSVLISTRQTNIRGQTLGIEIRNNNRFILGNEVPHPTTRRLEYGISQAANVVPNAMFNTLFINLGAWTTAGNEAVFDISVGTSKIYVLHTSAGSVANSTVSIYNLDGTPDSSFTIDVTTPGTPEYLGYPYAIAATANILYVAWNYLGFGSGSKLYAYSLTGDRMPRDDIDLGDLRGGTGVTYGITGLDWNETTNTLWMVVNRHNAARHIATLDLSPAVNALWSTIAAQTLIAGDTFDTKPFASGITRIAFGVGYVPPPWLTLNDGVLTVASTNLPDDSETTTISLVGIGSGTPDFIMFPLTLSRPQAPRWDVIPTIIRDEGETIDLNKFVTGADSISFTPGTPVPLGLTVSGGVISIPSNAVSTDTTVDVAVTATNRIGTTDATFELFVSNNADELRDVSFQHHLPEFVVMIDGHDVSEDVLSVTDISHTLDLLNPGNFSVAECNLVMTNGDRRYQRDGQFWQDNSVNPFASEVQVIGGIRDTKRRLFTGVVLGLNEDVAGQTVHVLCVDATRILREKEITDFGVSKRQLTLEGTAGYEGTYAMPEALTPVSEDSVSGSSGGNPLNVINDSELRVFGRLTPFNVKATETTLRSEGGLLNDDPILSIKSPHSYPRTAEFIRQLLANLGIHNLKINYPQLVSPEHFSSVGRAGFNAEMSDVLRYAKDWIYNDGNFYLIAGSPYTSAQDYLWQWNVAEDEWTLLMEFNTGHEMWSIASSDYDVFYILGTQARQYQWILPNGTYDSSEGTSSAPSRVKIWRFTRSTDVFEEFITASDNFPPQLAQLYSVGFTRENASGDRYGKVPDTRGGFDVHDGKLYYRYASSTAYGVAEADVLGNTSAFVTAPNAPDNFGGAAGCTFHISGDRIYVGYTTAPSDASTLRIVSRTFTSASLTTVASLSDPTSGDRYALTGVLEIFVHDGTCYFVTQRHPRGGAPSYARESQNNASAVLYRVSTSGATATAMKVYDYVQQAARSFVVHDNSVHFFEGSHVAYKFNPRLPITLPVSPDIVVEPPEWKDDIGYLRKISPDGNIEDLGITWRSALTNPNDAEDTHYGIHGGMCSPMHSVDGKLYLIAGYGNFDDINESGAEIKSVDNDAIIVYGSDIELRIPRLDTNNKTGYSLLQELARSTNSVFGTNHQRFFWYPRASRTITLTSQMSKTDTSLSFDEQVVPLPPQGYLWIDNELVSYTASTTTGVTGVVRGLGGTETEFHGEDAVAWVIRHAIFGTGATSPINTVTIRDDYTNIYNSIFINYGGGTSVYHAEDAASIEEFGRREFHVDTALHFTQIDWAKSLGDNYLKTFKDLNQVLTISCDLSLFLSIGDVVFISTKEISAVTQIYELHHNIDARTTEITARTVNTEAADVGDSSVWGVSVWMQFEWGKT